MKMNDEHGPTSGTVYKKTNGVYEVHSDSQSTLCSLVSRGSSSKSGRKMDPAELPVVGDRVAYTYQADHRGVIQEILPRQNQLSRRSPVPMPGAYAHEQVIAANLDQVVPVFAAANPAPHWNMLDRYLVSAESSSIPTLIIITKFDLVGADDGQKDELKSVATEYRRIGYPVQIVSAHTGAGLAEVRAALAGKVSALLGKSGVGKTSLLNALQPGLGLRVNQVSQVTGKGKHTTTQAELFDLGFGGAILDTPGVREFGLWGLEGQDLAYFFPEMRPYLGQCRFGLDCCHDEEPGCAVRKAVMAGQISPRRYKNFISLQAEQ